MWDMSASTEIQVYRRTFALVILLLAAVAFGVGKLAYLQSFGPPVSVPSGAPAQDLPEGTPTEATVQATPMPEVVLPSVRGNIYDCHGYLLAVSSAVYDIAAAPRQVTDTQVLAERLAPLVGKPRVELLELLELDAKYVPLGRGLRAEVKDRIMAWKLEGLQIDLRPSRIYAHGPLAACILGFVTDDGKAGYGLESYYDDLLAGKDGSREPAHDAFGSLSYQFVPPRDGADLFLTLDRNAQYIVEDALAQAVANSEAKKGVAIVIEPASGAILAMAVLPSYDPNTRAVDDPGVYTNSAISEHYEPGSVFKILTMAAALEAGIISPTSTYYDGGLIVVGGEEIENSDRLAHGETSMYELLAQSLNVGAAYLSSELGAFSFYEYLRRFGFAELTGVDLAYEAPGRVRFPGDRDWHESDLATNSFGQGLAATPLQMLCAVSAVANRGVLMRPYIVARIEHGGTMTETVPQAVRQAISPEVAGQVTEMLVYAVDHVLTSAAVPGFRVAGKSGTSEVAVEGRYDPDETIASFAGYVPADEPRFAILVTLEHPQKEHWGAKAAAPVFGEIAQRLLSLYAVPPDSVRASVRGQ